MLVASVNRETVPYTSINNFNSSFRNNNADEIINPASSVHALPSPYLVVAISFVLDGGRVLADPVRADAPRGGRSIATAFFGRIMIGNTQTRKRNAT